MYLEAYSPGLIVDDKAKVCQQMTKILFSGASMHQCDPNNGISMSEEGKESPIEFDPNKKGSMNENSFLSINISFERLPIFLRKAH